MLSAQRMFQLTTNTGIYIVHHRPSAMQQARYIRAMMARGLSASQVIFEYEAIVIHESPEWIVRQAERDAEKAAGKSAQMLKFAVENNLPVMVAKSRR